MTSDVNFQRDGFQIIPAVLFGEDLTKIDAAFSGLRSSIAGARQTDLPPAFIEFISHQSKLNKTAVDLIGSGARLVRVIAFDKTPAANWSVPWHQDRTIAVHERVELPGFQSWTLKDGIHHVEPPIDVLGSMVTLRLHLDDCGADSGPLAVLAQTHTLGRLTQQQIKAEAVTRRAITCHAERGGVVAMRPLLIHSSSKAARPSHRRVLHLEYAATDLAAGLHWHL